MRHLNETCTDAVEKAQCGEPGGPVRMSAGGITRTGGRPRPARHGPRMPTAPGPHPGPGAVLLLGAAEAVGFEPTVTSLPRRFSRPFP